MAKPTFDNLPPEKKERILSTAAKLFAVHGFIKTDVAQIAAAAGVAKGSMYNYFQSKDDIYRDVCWYGLEQSRRAVYEGMDPDWGIYRQIDHIFHRGAVFARESPEYVRLYMNVSSVGMERFADDMTREVERYTAEHLKELLRDGMTTGAVRSGIDVNMTAFAINGLYILFLFSLLSRHFEIRLMEYLELEGPMKETDRENVRKQLVGMICALLRPQASGPIPSNSQRKEG